MNEQILHPSASTVNNSPAIPPAEGAKSTPKRRGRPPSGKPKKRRLPYYFCLTLSQLEAVLALHGIPLRHVHRPGGWGGEWDTSAVSKLDGRTAEQVVIEANDAERTAGQLERQHDKEEKAAAKARQAEAKETA